MSGTRRGRGGKGKLSVGGVILAIALYALSSYLGGEGGATIPFAPAASPAQTSAPEARDAPGPSRIRSEDDRIARAYQQRQSGFMVTVEGRVAKVLPDDKKGSRHQRFIVELGSGDTVLVAHNIDLAARVPLGVGHRVAVYGQYEWNERGGVLHWTHHDPDGRHEEGWVRHEGRSYQ